MPQLNPVIGQHLSKPVAQAVGVTIDGVKPLVTGIKVLAGNETGFEIRFGF